MSHTLFEDNQIASITEVACQTLQLKAAKPKGFFTLQHMKNCQVWTFFSKSFNFSSGKGQLNMYIPLNEKAVIL